MDARLARGATPGGLFGIPLAIKDNIFFAGFPTTAATYRFRDFIPTENAEVVDASLSAGCIPVGKTNLHELALGATSAASYFGPVRNPYDEQRVAGGSSGGSAVAVAISDGPMLGLGTDTGGSVRVPAALCGVVGFKPTLGRLSLQGVFPLSPTLDHVGTLTKTVPDAIRAYEGLTSERVPALRANGKVRVGIPERFFLEGSEDGVLRSFDAAMDRLQGSGSFEVVEVPAEPSYERFVRARGYIQLREASWFYGGWTRSRGPARANADVLTLLGRGLETGEARYMDGNLLRLESIRSFGRLLKGVDAIAMPTTRVRAPRLRDVVGKEAGRLRRLLLQNTEVFNLCGFPALSIPSEPGRRTEGNGGEKLPVGIQLACGLDDDWKVLRVGERAARALAGS